MCASCCIRSSRWSATRPEPDRFPRRRSGGRRRAARELHPHPRGAHRGRGAARPDRRGDPRRARRRAPLREGLAADDVARRRGDRGDQEQSAAAAGRGDRRGDAIPRMAGRQQFHVPRRARIRADRRRARLRGGRRQRARHPALARRARAPPWQRARLDHAGDHGIPARSRSSSSSPRRTSNRACTGACTWTTSA